MINLKSTKKTPSINVGVNPITNITVSAAPRAPTAISPSDSSETKVYYPSVNPETDSDANISNFNDGQRNVALDNCPDPEKQALLREIQVLRTIIELQHSNPLMLNKYIVCDDEVLCKLVGLLCNAREVNLDAEDLGSGCLTKNNYRKVNSIYVINENGETLNLKYDYPSVMKTLKDLNISVKYVF
jgi:hypothetical protein